MVVMWCTMIMSSPCVIILPELAAPAYTDRVGVRVSPHASMHESAKPRTNTALSECTFQEHHLWHTKSVEGMSRFSGVIKLLPDPALPPGDAPKTAKGGVCTTGDECKSGLCSGSARQRRLLLFASVPGTLFCM